VEGIIVIALIIVNIFTVYRFIFGLIFRSREDFNKSLRYYLIPDFISLLKCKYWEDRISEFKLGLFIFLCIMATVVEYLIINAILGRIID